ncbi:hypothetical protein ACFVQB_24615 [Paenibacillus sp. NPDC057886]|uniref:hypothetical protein n=1 Tax=Paenibacillus sp. NPDC057886 TaxID=3346270 RepID=UPI0036C4241D
MLWNFILLEVTKQTVSELDIPIEIPSDTLEGYCYVIGIDDLIWDRLRASEYWSDARSLEWARYLIYSQFESIDLTYMREVAAKEDPKLAARFEQEYQWVTLHMFK